MLVDGTPEAEAIGDVVADQGLELLRADDTIAAESLFVAHRPSLIVLSLNDEGASAFCDLISAIPRGSGVPVILVGEENEALRAPVEASLRGEHAFIPRPVEAEELASTIAEMLSGSEPESIDERGGELSTREQTSVQQPPEIVDGVAPREPTQVLSSDPEPSADGLLDHSFGFSLTDFLSDTPMGFDADRGDGPHPWNVSVEMPGVAEDNFLEDDATSDEEVTNLEKLDNVSAEVPVSPLDDEPESPWTPPDDSSPPRPERTQVLMSNAGQPPVDESPASQPGVPDDAPPSEEGSVEHDAEVTQLSADFRKVIDEVAQRLFPEASPDEYGDEHFEELSTIVPVVDDHAGEYEDIDEYSLEAMETFTAGQGFTISPYGSPLSGDALPEDTQNEAPLGAPPTEGDANDDIADPPTFEAEAPPTFEGVSTHEKTRQAEVPGATGEASIAEKTDAAPPPELTLNGAPLTYGELADHSIPQLFAAAHRSRFDGTLVIRLPRERDADAPEPNVAKRTIVFDHGNPVVATTGRSKERMVELLLKKGRISQEHYEQCREQIELTERRAGTVLVDLGAISTRELFPLVRWHFRELIIACFSARRGTFWVEARPPLARWRIKLEPEAPRLLLEGLRRRWRAEELEPTLAPISRPRISSSLSSDELASKTGLSSDELELLQRCDGTRSLEQLIESASLERGQALAVLTGLELLGALGRRSAVKADLDDQRHDLERQRLEQWIARCWEADYFTLLGITPDASPYEVRLARDEILQELDAKRLAAVAATDLDERLDDVRYVVNEAYHLLRDEPLRLAYLEARFPESKPDEEREACRRRA